MIRDRQDHSEPGPEPGRVSSITASSKLSFHNYPEIGILIPDSRFRTTTSEFSNSRVRSAMDFAEKHPRLSEASIPPIRHRVERNSAIVPSTLRSIKAGKSVIGREPGEDEKRESDGFLSDQPRHYLNIPHETPALSALAAARALFRSFALLHSTHTYGTFFLPLSRARARASRCSRGRSTFADNAIVNRAHLFFTRSVPHNFHPLFFLLPLSRTRARETASSREARCRR